MTNPLLRPPYLQRRTLVFANMRLTKTQETLLLLATASKAAAKIGVYDASIADDSRKVTFEEYDF